MAEINGQILQWARETAGLDIVDAASKIGTSPERLQDWENADSYPTVKRLRQLAKVYMRPIGLFFLPELPEDPEKIRDFRKAAETQQKEMSSALRFEIRLAWERHYQAIELASDLGEEHGGIDYHFGLQDDPEKIATVLRKHLGILPAEQTHWNTKYEAFSSWRNAIESLGVLVFQTGVLRNLIIDPTEARGFSISNEPFPVIVVNGKDHASAKCFTLIHELAHLLLHQGGVCDLHDPISTSSHVDHVEVFCNRVAGAVLVPADSLLSESVVENHGRNPVWNDTELALLSKRFWVSWEVILRRLLILNRTTREYYQQWRKETPDRYPGVSDTAQSPRIPTHTRVVVRNGRLFPRIVLRALRADVITTYEASDILKAGPDRLIDIENAVY